MGIESALHDHLTTDSAIVALVGARVYPDTGPQSGALPYITHQVVSGEHDRHLTGGGGLGSASVQIDVWAATSAVRRSVADALFDRLHAYRGAMGSELLQIRSVDYGGTINSFERPTGGDEAGIYRARVDALIWYVESAANLQTPVVVDPVLSVHALGPISAARSAEIAGSLAIEVNGRIFAVGAVASQTQLAIYDDAPWATQAISGGTTPASSMFADTLGNVFFALVDSSRLYRIATGGTTPVLVLSSATSPAFTNATQDINTFAEDDDGNLYCNEYPGIGLYKSTDRGVTWSRIVDGSTGFVGSDLQNPNKANAPIPDDHLHGVFWDSHRKVLIVSHGDLSGSYAQVSGDAGATWLSWSSGLSQSTAYAFTATAIFAASDLDGDRGIYRAAVTTEGVAAVLASTPVEVFDPVTDGGAANDNEYGHAWAGWTNEHKQVGFNFGAVSAASKSAYSVVTGDDGTTWFVSASPAGAGAANADWAQDFSVSLMQVGRWQYGTVTGLELVAYRYSPANLSLRIDSVDGAADPYLSDGVLAPWAAPSEGLMSYRVPVALQRDLAAAWRVGQPGILVQKNAHDFTGTVTGSALATHDFETLPGTGWTESKHASASIALNTSDFKEGSNAADFTLTASATEWANLVRVNVYSADITAEPDSWLAYWVRVVTWPAASSLPLVRISTSGDYVQVQIASDGAWQIRAVNALTGVDRIYESLESARIWQWQRVKLHVVQSATAGRARLWVDDVLVLDVVGLNTVGNATMRSVTIGPTSAEAVTVRYDDVQIYHVDPDTPSGLVLAGEYQSVTA